MKTDNMNRQVCYNVQSAVDTKHHLIISHEVIQTTDRGQLTLVAKQVQQALGKQDITVIADKGYFSRLDIKATEDTCGLDVETTEVTFVSNHGDILLAQGLLNLLSHQCQLASVRGLDNVMTDD